MSLLCRKQTGKRFSHGGLFQLVRPALIMVVASAAMMMVRPSFAQTGCVDATVTNQTQLEAAIIDYNTNCGDGETLTVELNGGTITYTGGGPGNLNNSTTAILYIQNGTIDGNRDTGDRRILRLNPGNVIFENMLLTNSRSINGGGVRVDANSSAVLINTTMTDIEGSSGAALLNNNGSLTLINSTIANNEVINANATGGIWIRGDGAVPSFTMINSVVTGTTRDDGAVIGVGFADVYCTDTDGYNLTYSSGLSNLIGVIRADNGDNCGIAGTDFMTGDAQLGTLADNGGIVQTIAPLAGSPLVNGGNDAAALDSAGAALTTDARGSGFARINGAAVDIGAYELQGCNSATVTSRSELNAAISDFNSNCANGDTLTATVDGTISMTSSLTTLNNATDAVLLIEGGTIDANDSASVMRLNNGKAVFQNMTLKNANGLNGGTFFVDSNGDLTLINSTISNSIATTGGAIAIQNGVLTLTNTTISDTTRLTNGGAVVSIGGTMNLNNTIIANTVDNSANPVEDCVNSGGVVNFSAGLSNLIEDDVACGTAGTDFIEADPLLGTLADNGGKVETMILLPGSPAVNIGDNTAASGLTTDARGVGFPRILNGTVDLGATENEDLTPPALLTLDPADDSVNVVLTPTLRITLNETIQAGTGNITIHRVSDDGVAATFDVTTDVSFTTDTAEFTVPTALDDATEYYVSIPSGAITDSNGNAFAGFTDNATWSFTTRSFAADLSISKTDSADPVLAGSTLIYTLTVNNAGPDTAENVVVTDNLPTGVTLVTTNGCAEDPNGVTTCSLGDIASGGSAQYTIEVTVDAGTEGVITNNASVTADTGDLTPSNNSASEETTATPPPTGSLTLVKEADPEDGTNFTFTSDIPGGGIFSLDDEPSQSDLINQSITFADLPVGTYAITETLPSDWMLDGTNCTGASGSTSLNGETLTVPVGAGEVITCTFSNTEQDSNIILKDTFE